MKIELDFALLKSLLTLGTLIEARDAYTGGHTWRVSQYAKRLGLELGLNRSMVFLAQIGGLVHDIGKVGIPDMILNKKDSLTELEYTMMKKHPLIGHQVIESHPLRKLVEPAIVEHHERIDGRGYPTGLPQAELSIIGKITALADAFDAMTSTRPYRKGLPVTDAVCAIEENKGSQFDPELADSFIELVQHGELDHILGHNAENSLMISCPGCGPILAPGKNLGDGDNIVCPSCTGSFIAHTRGDTFELEWKKSTEGIYIPSADLETVDGIIDAAPQQLAL